MADEDNMNKKTFKKNGIKIKYIYMVDSIIELPENLQLDIDARITFIEFGDKWYLNGLEIRGITPWKACDEFQYEKNCTLGMKINNRSFKATELDNVSKETFDALQYVDYTELRLDAYYCPGESCECKPSFGIHPYRYVGKRTEWRGKVLDYAINHTSDDENAKLWRVV